MPPLSRTSSQHKGPCDFCINAFKWFPVVFILAIILWSYYAFVIQLCLLTIESAVKRLIYLFAYHIIFTLFIWAYYRTVFAKRAFVPDKFRLPEGEIDRLIHAEDEVMQNTILLQFSRDLPIYTRTSAGVMRYCEKCRHVKPDRAHHCSVCGRCILKMDHHCPWVNNCVCFTNYKFFILFLTYALLYSTFVACTSVEYFIQFWEPNMNEGSGRFHILFLFFVAIMFAISLASLFFYHLYLLSVNRTTLEAFRAPTFLTGEDNHGFDLGKCKNFKQVFGENPKLWLLPVFSTIGDGVCYPLRSQPPSGSYQTMENSQTSMGDGYNFDKRHTEEDREALLQALADS